MKIKFSVPKVLCKRTTRELGKDELYYAVILSSGSWENGEFVLDKTNPFVAKVSEIKTKISKKEGHNFWKPMLNDIEFDPGASSHIAVSFALYEKDNAELYKVMQEEFEQIALSEKWDWKEELRGLVKRLYGEDEDIDNLDWESIVKLATKRLEITALLAGGILFGLAKSLWKHFRQDDLIGRSEFFVRTNNEALQSPREYKYSGNGKYDVTLQLSVA